MGEAATKKEMSGGWETSDLFTVYLDHGCSKMGLIYNLNAAQTFSFFFSSRDNIHAGPVCSRVNFLAALFA